MLTSMLLTSALSATPLQGVNVLSTPAAVICSPTGNVGPGPSSSTVAGADRTSQVGVSTVVMAAGTAAALTAINRARTINGAVRGAERIGASLPDSMAAMPAGRRRGKGFGAERRGRDRSPGQHTALPKTVPAGSHHGLVSGCNARKI